MGCNNCYVPSNTHFSNVYIREVIKEEIISASDTLKGDSAYEVAVKLGYKGNEEEWLSEQGATIEQINVTTGAAGTNASVVLNGTPKNRRINLTIPRGDKGIQGEKGEVGLSSYEVALSSGFVGSKAQWLSSIKGEKGEKGDKGIDGIQGKEGKSTYDLSVDYGFVGSERQWLSGIVNDTELMSNLNDDLLSIDKAANGDINTTVVTRTGETYPSVKKAISGGIASLFENGGLPATPFATKALMTASALANGKYAMVTNDSVADNNGLYAKTAGAWVKSEYDPIMQAKNYTDGVFLYSSNSSKPDALMPLRNEASKKELDAYFGDYNNGVLVDPSQESEYQVLTVNNGVRTYESIESKLGTLFHMPKIVMDKDGEYGWSRHNFALKTDALDTAVIKSRCNLSSGARSITGANDAYLLVNTAVGTSVIYQNFTSDLNRQNINISYVVKAVNDTTHAMILDAFEGYALFNLTTGQVGDVVGMYNPEIVSLGLGYYRVSASHYNDISGRMYIGISDNNSKIAIKSGLTAIIEQVQVNLGGTAQDYLVNPNATPRVLPTFDYRGGKKAMLVEAGRLFVGMYSDDLTQADWVKSGLSVAMSAVSIVNDPCSRLTATTANATAIQTIPQIVKTMSVFIKRVKGVGAISLTLDGGVTWQNVTSEVSSSKYSRIIRVGSGTSYGIRLSNASDVVDVCMFNPNAGYHEISPVPYVYGSNATKIDRLTVILPATSDNILYCEVYLGLLQNTYSRYIPATFTNGATNVRTFGVGDFHTLSQTLFTASTKMGSSSLYNHLAFTLLTSETDNNYESSVNGGYPLQIQNSVANPISGLNINSNNTGGKGFEKILLINENVTAYDISNFKYTEEIKKQGDSNTCVVTKEKQFAGTTLMREPTLFVLSDDGDEVEMLVTHMNKNSISFGHGEAPARLLQRKIKYSKRNNEFTYMTPTQVMYEHDTWSEGKGHNQSPAVTRIKSGANAGRLICVFTRTDGDDFSAPRNIYRMFNDANGDANEWTEPEKIIDSTTSYGTKTVVNNPDGSILVLPTNHKVSPNRVITTVYAAGMFAPIYSDDGGDTWVAGDKLIVLTSNEPTISYLLNGDLVVNQRTETGGNRITHKSTDGGVTWALVGTMQDDRNAEVSGSLVQVGDIASPDGVDDLRLVISGSGLGRVGITISKVNSNLITLDSDYIIKEPLRYVGYSSAKPILNNEYMAVAFEGGTDANAFNNNDTSYLSVIKL